MTEQRRKKPKKPYGGRVHLGGGKYHWVGRYTTKRERDHEVAKARVELEKQGRLGTGVAVERMTVEQFAQRFLRDYEQTHKRSSFTTASQQLKAFRAEFGHRELRSLTRTEAKDWAARVDSLGWLPIVVTMLNVAVDDDLLVKNPFRGLGRRYEGRKNVAPPTDKELDTLLAACSVLKEYAPRMRNLIRFAAFTGMRPGEIFQLRWENVDFDRNRIHVKERLYRTDVDTPKNGQAKLIVLTPEAREALQTQPRIGEWVFTNKAGDRLAASSLSWYWQKVLAKSGLEFDFYLATKHYCVHYMYVKLDLSPRLIAEQMGWDVGTVDQLLKVYGHGDVGALEEIDAAFRRNVTNLARLRDARELREGSDAAF